MSEVMTQGIIGMPFDLAMSNELSRRQFHGRAQSLLSDYDALAAELATVKKVAYGNLELMEDRDAALAECERLRASLNDAAKAMHWVQANTPMSKRISASLAKARLAAELSALSAKP